MWPHRGPDPWEAPAPHKLRRVSLAHGQVNENDFLHCVNRYTPSLKAQPLEDRPVSEEVLPFPNPTKVDPSDKGKFARAMLKTFKSAMPAGTPSESSPNQSHPISPRLVLLSSRTTADLHRPPWPWGGSKRARPNRRLERRLVRHPSEFAGQRRRPRSNHRQQRGDAAHRVGDESSGPTHPWFRFC